MARTNHGTTVFGATADAYQSLDNSYMQARATDVIDAGNRVLQQLTGDPRPSMSLNKPSVVVAHDLLPSEVAQLDPKKVSGLVTAVGGSTSHAAILARELGLPAVDDAVHDEPVFRLRDLGFRWRGSHPGAVGKAYC